MKKFYYFFLMMIALLFETCNDYPDSLNRALKESGSNRVQLEAVLKHYRNDTLKLKAARYLIQNMPYHYSQDEYYESIDGEKIRPDITKFKDRQDVKIYCDSLLEAGYTIKKDIKPDIQFLDSSFIINNIDLAFSVWKKPWSKDVSFQDFCRYILPYRAQTEMVSSLRKEIMNRFISILDSAKVTSPLAACRLLNDRLKYIIKFKDPQNGLYPTIEEAYYSGISQCDGMCNLGIFIMRSVGIPVTVDFTRWVKMDLGHTWCTVLDNGTFYAFGPGEDQPIDFAVKFSKKRYLRPAKVYRFQFDAVNRKVRQNDDGYKSYLKNQLMYDVTTEYLDKPIDIKITTKIKEFHNKKSSQIYLCTHNFYRWQPIAIGRREGSSCIFNNVVGDNVFIVADVTDKVNLRFITPPFYVDKIGSIHEFIPDKNKKQFLTLKKLKDKLTSDYTLYYWNCDENRFISIPFARTGDSTQSYDQVPGNSLLWFTIPEQIVNQKEFFCPKWGNKILLIIQS